MSQVRKSRVSSYFFLVERLACKSVFVLQL